MSACPVCGCDAAAIAEEIKEQRADIRALAGWIRKPGPCPRCADKERDLAMAMAELRSVAQQRDKALTERDAARAGYSAMNTRIYGPGGECRELDKARAERDKLSEALERNCVQYVQKQQALIAERDKLRAEREAAALDASRARQSLRAAEQDVADLEADNSTLRTVNLRILADYRAAMQRADTAEAILRAKA